MLLSKCRLRWATVALLIICGVLLFQPTRVWLQRVWITAALGPQVSVGEIVYHGKSSIVEVRGLSWHGIGAVDAGARASTAASIRKFAVTAPRCWLGLDRPRLADGRIYLPKVILQDAVISLASSFPETNSKLEDWRQAVARHQEQFDWRKLEPRANCLDAADHSLAAWLLRTEDLVNRSRSILAVAARIDEETQGMDNPLRFADSIRAQLERYSELVAAQRSLSRQLGEIDDDLARETRRLEELHGQDKREWDEQCSQLQDVATQQNSELPLDQRLALVLAQAGWDQVAPFGEIVAHTSQAAASIRQSNYDVTVRAASAASDQIQCSDLKASGEFRFAQVKSPFQTSGAWRLAQQRPGEVFRELNSRTLFDCQTHQLEVSGSHDSRKSTGIQLRIRMLNRDVARRARPTSAAEAMSINSLSPVTAHLTSEAGRLTGTLCIAAEALPLLSHTPPRDDLAGLQEILNDSADKHEREALQFDVRGTWQAPEFKLSSPPAAWLQRAVEAIISQRSQEVIALSQTKLDAEFKLRMEQMQERISLAARAAQAVVSGDESRLLTSQQSLQQRLDEINGTEFARRPGEVQR